MFGISDISRYYGLAFGLRDFLRNKITLEQSKKVISTRLQNREKNFLNLIQKVIYENPESPYLKLLRNADCEFGDIESLVNKDGVEPTLSKLLKEGVYISWEEFKGKRDVIRGGNRFQVRERDFDNPLLPDYYHVKTSGSRGAGTRTIFDLKYLREKSYYTLPMLAVHNALNAPMGLWMPGLPSIAGISPVLRFWSVERPIVKWFSPVTESQVQASLRDRLATRYIIYSARLWGAKLVKPEYAGLAQAVKVARWMADTKKQFGTCAITCFVSPAVKICQAAIENGLDIKGTRFFVGGEPLTEAKRQQIEASGALAIPRYFITEIDFIGCGCPGAVAVDDVHFFHDSLALIEHQRKVEHTDAYVNAFHFTNLSSSAPKVMLNVESDDYGVMETRSCGCLFEKLGFTRHLHNIRSFSKLTGSGMTIIGSDFVHILEKVLPEKYGGAATDYQLLEEEDNNGQTRLNLIVSPSVGAINDSEVINTVLSELYKGVRSGKLAAGFWSQVNTLQVKRIYPMSSSGKVMTLHLTKQK